MKKLSNILLIAFCLLIISCSRSFKTSNTSFKSPIKPVIFAPDSANYDGPDFTMSITETLKLDSSTIYKVSSLYKERIVGFQLEIPDSGKKKKQIPKLKLKSIGVASTNFLNLLTDLAHSHNNRNLKFADSISLNYINLHEFANDKFGFLPNHKFGLEEYKLFLESDPHKDGVELYLNISKEKKIVQIQEKESNTWPVIIQYLKRR